MKKFLVITVEILAIIAVFMAALVGVVLWRMSSSPIDLAFAKPHVEKALSTQAEGLSVTMDKLILHWPDRKGPVLLGLRKARVQNASGNDMIAIDEAGIGLSLPYLLIGQIVPTTLVLQKPYIDVIRTKNGTFDIGLGQNNRAPQGPVKDHKRDAITQNMLDMLASPGMDNKTSPLKALKQLEVKNAVLSLNDQAIGSHWHIPDLSAVLISQSNGVAASIAAQLDNDTEAPAMMTISASIPWQSQTVTGKVSITDFPLSYLADKITDGQELANQDVIIAATIEGEFDKTLTPQMLKADLSSSRGHININAYRPESVLYKNLIVKASYDNQKLLLEKASAIIGDVPLTITGTATEQADSSYQTNINLKIPSMRQDQFEPLWPESLKEEGAYEWLVEKLSHGTFSDIHLTMDAAFDEEGVFDLINLKAGFNAADMTVDYRAPLPVITGVTGSGTFDYQSELLHIDVVKGIAGNLTLRDATVELAHIIEGGKGHADVNLSLDGTLKDVFAFLEHEPIAFDHGYDLNRMTGGASLNVNLGIPTYGDVQMEDIELNVRGKASKTTIPHIIEDIDLTAANASVVIKGNDIDITGAGHIITEPIDFNYKGFLVSKGKPYEEKIKISGTMTETIRTRLDIDLSTFLSGPALVNATYTNAGTSQTITATADLTSAHIFAEPFAYNKLPGDKATASMNILMNGAQTKEINSLNVTAPDLSITNGRLTFTQRSGKSELSAGDMPIAQIGQTKGRAEFTIEPSGRYKITADLTTLDARPFLDDNKKDKPAKSDEPQIPLIISATAQTMLTHEKFGVKQTKLYIDLDQQGKFNQLEMDALAGGSDIYLRYKPDATTGQRNFRFEADDAGATLAAFGLYDKILGGKISISAQPMGGLTDRNLVGTAQITNFEVVGAPTLAKLLSLMSIEGLAAGMNAGIQFSRLESQFDWLYRPQGSILVLQEGRTSGNAVGLTFDGTVDQAQGVMDISGTIIPVSQINKAIGSIPVLGEILTGGSGIFAATYSVKGNTKDPEISVNPLSVLAPGILRKILFE